MTSTTYPLYEFLVSFFLSFLLLIVILPGLRKSFLDLPNSRSSHSSATPRGGGVAFVAVGSAFHFLLNNGAMRWIPILCLPLALVGMIDDYKSLPASWRYFTQFMTAILLLVMAKMNFSIIAIPFLCFVITAIINFMNFLDGMDGLLAGCAVLLLGASSAWSISGAVFGFLLLNWSPAKVFMGDVGSTFIGALFAGLVMQQPTGDQALTTLFLGFPLIGDASTCVIRRYMSGKDIFSPHRTHLYQRLNQAGWNHRKVASLYIFAVALLIIARGTGSWQIFTTAIIAETVAAIFLDSKVAVRFDDC
jgi:Fuc2NAc and GlcNAc transferase